MHHWLKEVVIHPHFVIQHIHRSYLLRGLQADGPEILANERIILLLDKAIIIFLIGTAPTQLEASDRFTPEAHQVMVEEFGAIIGMQFFHRKGRALQDVAEAPLHGLLSL